MKNTPRIATFFLILTAACVIRGGESLRGEEIFSATEPQRSAGEVEAEKNSQGSEGTVVLEGGVEAYDSTALTVKRSITVERDGEVYHAKVFTPVMTRRGAIFLNREQIGEMLSIKSAMEQLVKEVAEIQEKAKGLEGRYASLISQARKSMLETFPAERHRGKVELVQP